MVYVISSLIVRLYVSRLYFYTFKFKDMALLNVPFDFCCCQAEYWNGWLQLKPNSVFLLFLLKRELVKGIIHRYPEIQPSNDLKDSSRLLVPHATPRIRWAFCKRASGFLLHLACVWLALCVCAKSRRGCAFSPSRTNHLLIPLNKNCAQIWGLLFTNLNVICLMFICLASLLQFSWL